MMLCKLSLKNIKKSFKDYAIYFFTLILGVSIFYVFNAIESQTIMMDVTKSTRSIIELMTNMLSGVSVFVSFILGFLIIYASRFLIKRRKKEFGIYLTLGMSKQKISLILFFETLLIGIISLIVGLGIGVILSQVMSLLVINLFEADMTNFKFIFSSSSCLKTLTYFGIIYILVMLFNTINIGKQKLINLLYGGKKSEKIKMKNPYLCLVVFIISTGILGFAYYMVTGGVETMMTSAENIFIPIAMGCIGTFGVIWSLAGLLLKFFQKTKKIYYKGLNSFTLRQISSKINTTVFSMSVISIMLFVTICVFSSALSIKNASNENLKNLVTMDIELTKRKNLTEEIVKNHYRYTNNMIEDSRIALKETLEMLNLNWQDWKELTEYKIYEGNITLKDTLGNYFSEAKAKYPFATFYTKEEIMSLNDYNKIAKLYHQETLNLNENEYVIVADYDSIVNIRNEGLKRNPTLEIGKSTLTPKLDYCVEGSIHMASNHINSGIIIVPENVVKDLEEKEENLIANYNVEAYEEKKELEEKIVNNLENHPYLKKTTLDISTKISIYESSVGLGALVTFIGLYLGIIFLISSAAILALKELSETSDNKERFGMLRKIGCDEKLLEKALFRQIGIFFLFPLILACIHSIFGIKFANYILETFGEEKLLLSIIITSIFLVIIYGGYFLITYICSKRIIKER